MLSPHYAGGVDLSGGQWQRIALARALYAVQTGARVLVLDEPTSQLDVRARAAFYDRFLELTAGVTSMIISHRFASVRRANRIAVLDGGQITKIGSHQELLDHDGVYAELFGLQAAGSDFRVGQVIRRWRRTAGVLLGTGFRAAPLTPTVCLTTTLAGAAASVLYSVGYRVIVDGAIAHDSTSIALGAGLLACLFTLAWAMTIIGGTEERS